MPIEWNMPLRARNGRKADLLPREGWQDRIGSTERRVAIIGDYAASLPRNHPDSKWPTVYLVDENGRCREDGVESDFDVVNAEAALAA